jgi:hypothetical protein
MLRLGTQEHRNQRETLEYLAGEAPAGDAPDMQLDLTGAEGNRPVVGQCDQNPHHIGGQEFQRHDAARVHRGAGAIPHRRLDHDHEVAPWQGAAQQRFALCPERVGQGLVESAGAGRRHQHRLRGHRHLSELQRRSWRHCKADQRGHHDQHADAQLEQGQHLVGEVKDGAAGTAIAR